MRIQLTFFIILITSSYTIAQESKNIVFNEHKHYLQSEVDSIFYGKNYKSALDDQKKILESNKKLIGWSKYYFNKAKKAYNKDKLYDSCLVYLEKAIEKYENNKNKRALEEEVLLQIFYYKGKVLEKKLDYKEAITNYHKALNLNKKYPYKWKGFINAGIINSHVSLGNDSLGLKYIYKCLNDSLYMSLDRPAITTYVRAGWLNYYSKNYLDAKMYCFEGLDRSKNSNYQIAIRDFYNLLGYIELKTSNKENAIPYFKKAVIEHNKNGLGDNQYVNLTMSTINAYILLNSNDIKGVNLLKKSLSNYDTINKFTRDSKDDIEICYNGLIDYYTINNNASKAKYYKERFLEYLEKFHEIKLKNNLQKIEIVYQTKEKDYSIKQLKKNEIAQKTIIKQQQYLTIGAFSLLVLGSVIVILFWKQKKLINNYEKQNLEQRLLRSQMNPHFISNALNTIIALVDKNSSKTIDYTRKLSGLIRLILENSREEFITLEDEITTLKGYLDLQSNFSERFDYKIFCDDDIPIDCVIIPPMMIQPLIENAILHGFHRLNKKGIIVVKLFKNNNSLQCEIIDNGIGLKNDNLKDKSRSVSSSIIKERLLILEKKFKTKCKLEIIALDDGVKSILYLPFVED